MANRFFIDRYPKHLGFPKYGAMSVRLLCLEAPGLPALARRDGRDLATRRADFGHSRRKRAARPKGGEWTALGRASALNSSTNLW